MMSDMTHSAPDHFVQLCTMLYGPAVDAQTVWEDVHKAGPDQADVSTMGQPSRKRRVLEGLALGSTVAGGALGIKEGISVGRAVSAARKAGHLIPAKEYGKAGVAALATGGDALTTGVLASQNKKSKLQPTGNVAKFDMSSQGIKAAADGLRRLWNPAAAAAGAAKAAPPAAGTRAAVKAAAAAKPKTGPSAAMKAGQDAGKMLSTTSGKVATGLVGVGAAKKVKRAAAGPPQIEYVPDYGVSKNDDEVVWEGTFSKLDEDKHLAFGWASVTKMHGQPVVDKQGDFIDADDLEDAVYKYVHSSRVGSDMHQRTTAKDLATEDSPLHLSDMVESVVFTDEKVAKMGLPEDFPRGWWVGYRVNDEQLWSEIRKGNRTGFSIHGRGVRKDHDLDALMGY